MILRKLLIKTHNKIYWSLYFILIAILISLNIAHFVIYAKVDRVGSNIKNKLDEKMNMVHIFKFPFCASFVIFLLSLLYVLNGFKIGK